MLFACSGVSNKRYPLTIPDNKKDLELVVSSENLLTWASYAPSSEDFLKEKQYFATLENIPLGISLENFNKTLSHFNFEEKRYIDRKNNSKNLWAKYKDKINNIYTEESTTSSLNVNSYKTKQVVSEYDFLTKFRICRSFQKDLVDLYNFRITKFVVIDHTYFENKLISLSIKGPYYIIPPAVDSFDNHTFGKYFFGEVPIQNEEIMKKIPVRFWLDYQWSLSRPLSEADIIEDAMDEISKSKLKNLIGQKYADRVRFRVDFKPLKMTNEDILNLKNN
jgi:hypothetical protein